MSSKRNYKGKRIKTLESLDVKGVTAVLLIFGLSSFK